MTYQEIGEALGVSHQAIWEIEKRAIIKLQKKLIDAGFTIEDFERFNLSEVMQ